MGTPLTTRVILKAKRIVRELSVVEREFARLWPSVDLIEGWLTRDEAKWLYKRARALPDGAHLAEIGSYKGRSTSCLAFGCRHTNKRVYAVDTFDGGPDLERHDSFEEFHRNIGVCRLAEYVEAVRGISWHVAKNWRKPLNFLFIDGSHLYEDVSADFATLFPHVVPGGIVAFHDVHESHPGVLRAWRENIKGQLADIGYCDSIGYGTKPKGKMSRS